MERELIKSVGIDLVEVARIKADVEKHGKRFLERILGPRELEAYQRRADKEIFLSGRFAAKEAVVKGLGAFISERPALNRLEVLNDPSGRPELKLPGDLAEKLKGVRCHLSITHDKNYGMAVAVFEEEK